MVVTTAVDKEVHQGMIGSSELEITSKKLIHPSDHYHTSVQPVKAAETLPEQHHHRMVPVEERQFDHGSNDDVKGRLAQESSKFRDESQRVEGSHMTSAAPAVAGEHVHHHVHETIQVSN